MAYHGQSLSLLACYILLSSELGYGETDAYEVEDEVILAYAAGQQKPHTDVTQLILPAVITVLVGFILFLIYSHGKSMKHVNNMAAIQDCREQKMQRSHQEEIEHLEEMQRQEMQKCIDKYNSTIRSMRLEQMRLNETIGTLQQRLKQSSESATDLSNQLKAIEHAKQAEIRKLQEEHCKLEEKLSLLEQYELEYQKNVQLLQNEKKKLLDEQKHAEERFHSTQSQLQHKHELTKQSLERKLEEKESQMDSRTRELEQQLNQRRMLIEHLESKLHEKEEECKSNKEQLIISEESKESKKSEIDKLRSQIKNLKKELLSISSKADMLDIKLAKTCVHCQEECKLGNVKVLQQQSSESVTNSTKDQCQDNSLGSAIKNGKSCNDSSGNISEAESEIKDSEVITDDQSEGFKTATFKDSESSANPDGDVYQSSSERQVLDEVVENDPSMNSKALKKEAPIEGEIEPSTGNANKLSEGVHEGVKTDTIDDQSHA